jgi:glucose-6-phosphate dehydrogenase assembly protein OpcA
VENLVTTDLASRRLSIEPRAVDVAAIERGLAQLWTAAQEGTDSALTQACMSNLIIWCSAPQAMTIATEVASIVERHPARVLLLVPNASDLTTDIEAYVSAQCHLSGGGRQVCSEYVTVSAQSAAVRRLPSVARPLLIGDLPTTLWWAANQAPPRSGSVFEEFAAMSNQVIYDSREWVNPAAGLAVAAEWIGKQHPAGVALSDLAWRRLDPWRRALSETLDPARLPGALTALGDVEVTHGPHGLSQTLLLLAWLAGSLGWQAGPPTVTPGIAITWELRAPSGPARITLRRASAGEPDVQCVRASWSAAGRARSVTVARTAPERLTITIEGGPPSPSVQPAPQPTLATLLVEQLPDLHGDPLFENALALSGVLAQSIAQAESTHAA